MTTETTRWQVDGPGGELYRTGVTLPGPGAHEVVVRTDAVALNFRDAMMIDNVRGVELEYPFTPASDLAGTVVDTGAAANRFRVGDRVISTFTPDWRDGRRPGSAREPHYRTLGGHYRGVLAEHVVLDENWFVPAPRTLGAVEASTLPCAGLTAWFALAETGHVAAGQTVLVEGTGGVSLFGLQVAKLHGAEVILVGSPGKLDRARELGADHVLDRNTDWVDSVYRLTGDRGVDHVLEVVGGAHLSRAARSVAVGGHIHLIGSLDGFELSSELMPLLLKNVTLHGVSTGHRSALERLVAAMDANAVAPVIDTVYDFAEAPAAVAHLRRGALGKVVVSFA